MKTVVAFRTRKIRVVSLSHVATFQVSLGLSGRHLPKNFGNFGWNVNGKANLVFPNGKFPEKTKFLKR